MKDKILVFANEGFIAFVFNAALSIEGKCGFA